MNKRNIKKKIDLEAKLFMALLHLKEEKSKKYSIEECPKNIAYLFDNYDEFKNYFELNGFDDISEDLLEICRMKTTKKGTIIALKGLCDHAIRKHNSTNSLSEDKKANSILDNLGSKGVENIINNPTPLPDTVYRPNYYAFTADEEDKKKEILFEDFPELHITEETRQAVLDHPELHSGLSVRARMGKFYTDEEWEQRREDVLSTPLPGGEEKGPSLVKKRIRPKNTENK